MRFEDALIINYKSQIEHFITINDILRRTTGIDEIEIIVQGLQDSQRHIDCLINLEVEKVELEKKIMKIYNMPIFDIEKLDQMVDVNLSQAFKTTLNELKNIMGQVMQGKERENNELKDKTFYIRGKYGEVLKGKLAYKGYKKQNYDAIFIDKKSK